MKKILDPRHMDELHGSGLNDGTIDTLGFYSGTVEEVEDILGFNAGPGLIIPYPCASGDEPFYRVKPDVPLIIDGKPAKYLSARGATVRAYIPPQTWEALKDPTIAVLITEGEKKAAKADQEGFPCIGLSGIWGFSQNHQLIPDLASISWEGRKVFLLPDSDYQTNLHVKLAVFTLERWLTRLGALVVMIRIPASDDSLKVGLDDFLVARGPEDLKLLQKEAKPSLFWHIGDIAALPMHERLKPLHSLFEKLTDLDPIEISLWKKQCIEKLDISTSEFKAQLKLAHNDKQRKQTLAIERDAAKTAEENRLGMEREADELLPKVA